MTKDELAEKSLKAVNELLDVIRKTPAGVVGNFSSGGGAHFVGTHGYFAAKAIRELLETPIIGAAVREHLDRSESSS